ncbi:hypothetical protein F7R14_14795 [Pseudomonas lini]|uniref:Uncharacterized protein n=1 Tax=Pseudomonas lini TaxID=163011 RepID=A0A7V7TLI4_9PSED|nr:hypothetical protein F7R14_14795 [Pseudomonas lini]MDT9676160.1 hypothetical protein [Pseudomonas sp. JV414]
MARGLAPVGSRSGPKTSDLNFPDTQRTRDLRLLRSRTGASPLATGKSPGHRCLLKYQCRITGAVSRGRLLRSGACPGCS